MIYLFPESEQTMLAYLLPGMAFGFAAAVTPGPLSMYLFSQAVSHGRRHALPIAFAPLLSDGPIAALILTVLSRVPDRLVHYLHLLGGFFILYLAFGAWKSWRDFRWEKEMRPQPGSNSLLKAVLVNWLNPNPYLGWSTILGPMVLKGWRDSAMNGAALILGFYLTMIATMIAMILLFAAAGTLGPRIRRSLIGLSSIALACLGLYMLWLGSGILRTPL
jgi:threonine/homoserine/homoserine lactone efflux protein